MIIPLATTYINIIYYERERERKKILTRERGGLRREGTRETRKGGRKGKGR